MASRRRHPAPQAGGAPTIIPGTIALYVLLSGCLTMLGCRNKNETYEIRLRIDSSKQVSPPQTKEELISFIKGDLDPRILKEFVSLTPWDVLFSEHMLGSILEMLYYSGTPDRMLELINYPFISDRILNPFRVLCIHAYSELKSLPLEEFHLMVIRDPRFDKEKSFEDVMVEEFPWWNDSNEVNKKVRPSNK